ncbi:transglutaminase-like domain-containing protein [Streptomyces sp. NPDC004610]|uniref:transglutaminase-like domain-containing protein n=1 Tax=unclassified Streptomyces TaxID=2593676 RepID=UPI0033BE3AC4
MPSSAFGPSPGPRSPSPERVAEVRRRFAEEARAESPDLATLCLLIGAQADAALDDAGIDAGQLALDELAGMLPFRPGGPGAWAAALREVLGARLGFHGSPAEYGRLEASLLHRVLERRRGLPILLSVVWVEVARRAGAPVHGVALPGHFVVGLGPVGRRPVLVDPFDGGRVLSEGEVERLVAGATDVGATGVGAGAVGGGLGPGVLAPAGVVQVVRRVLNNVGVWARGRPERVEVALWAVELGLLLPSHAARLRYERGRLLVERGDFVGGAVELEGYAEVVEGVDAGAAEVVRGEARAARARLN